MKELEQHKAETLRIIEIAGDGGTAHVEVSIEEKNYDFYIDGRIDSETPGEIFDSYPGPSATMLTKDCPLTLSIKEIWQRRSHGD